MAQNPSGTGNKGSMTSKVTDPVCGMSIDRATAAGSTEYKGQRYFFCSAGCKTRFETDPAKFAGAASGSGGTRG